MSFIDDQRKEDERNANRRRAAINRLNLFFGIAPSGTKQDANGLWVEPKPTAATITPPGGVTGVKGAPGYLSGSAAPAEAWMKDPQWKSIDNPIHFANIQAKRMNNVYKSIGKTVEDYQRLKLGEDLTRTNRESKFELARRGQLGGSVAVDVGGDIRRLNDERLLDISNLAQSAVTDAKNNDNEARLNAARDINADVDASSSIASALNQRALSAGQAIDFGKGQAMGDAFANLAYLYGKVRDARATDAARRNYSGFGPSSGVPIGGNAGTITKG